MRRWFTRLRGPRAGRLHVEIARIAVFALGNIEMLNKTPSSTLRELTFSYPCDSTDVYTLKTDIGTGYFDQGTGAPLAWITLSRWDHISETIYMLHTGQGAAAFGLAMGPMVLGLPVMGITGVIMWWNTRRNQPRLRVNKRALAAISGDGTLQRGRHHHRLHP